MSSLVILPAEPVPGTLLRSRLFSLAILRTRGEERTRSPVSVSLVSPSASLVAVAAATGEGGAVGMGAAAVPTAVPGTLRVATTALICTVVPACTLISASTPAAGDGISASTLSVEISKRGSSCCTASPGFFNHLVMVPSKIDSPIWGMITSVRAGAAVPASASGVDGAAGALEGAAAVEDAALGGSLAADEDALGGSFAAAAAGA